MEIISTKEFIDKYKHVNFLKMAKKESHKRVHERLLAIHHLCDGKSRNEAAATVGRSDEWLRSWVLKYHAHGYEGLKSKKQPGAIKYLTPGQEKELVEDILKLQDNRNGGRLTGNEIIEHIENKFNVTYKSSGIYDLLERIGLTWVSSRSKHPKGDLKKQKSFKQTFKARMAKIKAKKKENRNLVPG